MSYQTVKLEAGPHNEGEGKACVMEVVSMLAHEDFTDSPDCTCPVITGMLQALNDCMNDEERQSLWLYATKVVNTNDGKHLERLHKLNQRVGYHDPSNWAVFGMNAEEEGNIIGAARCYTYALVHGRSTCDRAIAFLDSLLPETEEIPAEELIAVKRELAAA